MLNANAASIAEIFFVGKKYFVEFFRENSFSFLQTNFFGGAEKNFTFFDFASFVEDRT